MTGNPLLFTAVADDDTGASDLAGMFADQGVPVVLVLDATSDDDLRQWTAGACGIVFATADRALPRELAVARTLAAFDCAKSLNPRHYLLKYCSTFDSTEQGNIGPTIDAALATLGETFTIALPALPVNGRTTYCGYHFVNGQLLSDSPMRLHPLNPMTNPNLVDFLSRQTSRRVGLTSYTAVNRGPAAIATAWEELRRQGCEVSIVDCLDDTHAASVCEAACGLKLMTGGSAFGTHLPPAWRRRGWLPAEARDPLAGIEAAPGRGRLVVAGSCSVATSAQNAWLEKNGAAVFTVDAVSLLESGQAPAPETLAAILLDDGDVLLKTDGSPQALLNSREWCAARNITTQQMGLMLAETLARLVAGVAAAAPPKVLVSAGGETSSALCRALGVRALAVGRNIQPGVPLCVPLSGRATPLVLKSGNFGAEDFYGAAFQAAASLS
jgi:uncharacterized protein YgbK (DUF1537 family)